MPRPRKPASLFRYLNSSPDVIRFAVMMCVRFPLSQRNGEDLHLELGIAISHELCCTGGTGTGREVRG